jgi:hypothetical protein
MNSLVRRVWSGKACGLNEYTALDGGHKGEVGDTLGFQPGKGNVIRPPSPQHVLCEASWDLDNWRNQASELTGSCLL